MSKKLLTSLFTAGSLMLSTPTLSAKPVHEMTQEEVRANIERIITSSPEMQQYAHNIGIDVS